MYRLDTTSLHVPEEGSVFLRVFSVVLPEMSEVAGQQLELGGGTTQLVKSHGSCISDH